MIIRKEELQRKYNSMNNHDLAKELGVSIPTLMKIIDDNGIQRKGSGNSYHYKKIQVV